MATFRTLARTAAVAAVAMTSPVWAQGSMDPHRSGQAPAAAGTPAQAQQGGTPGGTAPGMMGQGAGIRFEINKMKWIL